MLTHHKLFMMSSEESVYASETLNVSSSDSQREFHKRFMEFPEALHKQFMYPFCYGTRYL